MSGDRSKRTRAAVSRKQIYAGSAPRKSRTGRVQGGFVTIDKERFYRIADCDLMSPFFMSLVSPSDHWMFVSSNGALTAGRKNPEHALFPYYTVDKIHDSHGITGGLTVLLVDVGERVHLWEPLAQRSDGLYDVQRNLYKNKVGNKLLFEEENHDLGLTFQTLWTTSDRFGFVKRTSLRATGGRASSVRVLDGIQNILPYGTDLLIQTQRSTLLDAYKKSELLPECGLGLFLLSSVPVDRPEPSEALSATTVWSVGLDQPQYLLSTRQVDRFRRGEPLETEVDVRAQRGAYLVSTHLPVSEGMSHTWHVVADVDQGPADVAALRKSLGDPSVLRQELERDIAEGTIELERLVAAADGLQLTADELSMGRHFTNVLFNVMRGGTFADGYRISRTDLIDFVQTRSSRVASDHLAFFQSLPDPVDARTLLDTARAQQDADLTRLCHEYLPLSFSRRHGDPSRPWNYFSIDVRADDGSRVFNYEGNWRDIFQNWEALLMSFPEFTGSIITKFVNASTPDGYNPYRITRDGIDWETEDPSDPWSFIGYWGDHQIIYLLKLLEISRRFHPGELENMLEAEEFAYANVPYRIRPYERLLEDPHSTIDFDDELADTIERRVAELGSDGRLVWNPGGEVHKATLLEKILVSVLTKYSNFIPEAGIWLNTQRPEWNDANNALVGFGVSTVTLCYLRRFQHFLRELLADVAWEEAPVCGAVASVLAEVTETFRSNRELLTGKLSNVDRKRVLDALGRAGARYREKVYGDGLFEEKVAVSRDVLLDFIDLSLEWTDHSIRANRRSDGLYHSYNLMEVDADGVAVSELYQMLEGQVAVLSSGLLSPREAADVLAALRSSALYQPDQYSYLLYPDRSLPRFEEKNRIPEDGIASSRLLTRLLASGDVRLVVRDEEGVAHFSGTFRNRHDVAKALDDLAESDFRKDALAERDLVLDLFERVFGHRSYTGRSGTFFGYEGLGCIYWHMVSKLLLATAETFHRAVEGEASDEILGRLVEHYYSIRAGIGLNKTPELYGAFPTDPYSHTPRGEGARQPGMTGQVKEDILARWEELGVKVQNGRLSFVPSLFRASEFLVEPVTFEYFDLDGIRHRIEVDRDELAFTYCQIPIVYRKSSQSRIVVTKEDGERVEYEGRGLDADLSREFFSRSGSITSVEVEFNPRF